jgi:hypothetical protein
VYQSTGDPQVATRAVALYVVHIVPLYLLGVVATFCSLACVLAALITAFALALGFGIVSALSWWAFVKIWRSYFRSRARLLAPPPSPGPRAGERLTDGRAVAQPLRTQWHRRGR